jgi:hypothetical protein
VATFASIADVCPEDRSRLLAIFSILRRWRLESRHVAGENLEEPG